MTNVEFVSYLTHGNKIRSNRLAEEEDLYFFSTFSDGNIKKGNEYIKIKGT